MYFDGVCKLCTFFVDWLIRRDKRRVLRYASLQSPAGERVLARLAAGRSGDGGAGGKETQPANGAPSTAPIPRSVILQQGVNLYTDSDAVLRVAALLGYPWRAAKYLRFVPSFIRDRIYRWIADNRYAWFGMRNECRVPTDEERDLFVED